MKVAEFIKRYQGRHAQSLDNHTWDHSLAGIARKHTQQPGRMHTGTIHDWEDLERYQEELERLEREGPGRHNH